MKILHVVPSYLPAWRYGGTIYAVHGMCKALVLQGHEVHLFTTNVDGPVDSDVILNTQVDIDGVQVWYFPSKHLRRLYYSPFMKKALKSRIEEFDIVHLHSVYLWPTWAAAKAARAANIHFVMSPHGMLVKDMIMRKSRVLKSLWLALIERRNIEHAAAIHVTAQAEKLEIQKFNYRLHTICSVPNGVDIPEDWCHETVSEDVLKVTRGAPYVLYLGRINWKKGLDRLIKLWREVPAARIVIAGNDEENYLPKLQAIAIDSGVSDRVVFLARSIKGADKEILFAKASLFVLPSYSENFGITVVEAMVRSVPVVVTEEVGAKEVVKDAKGGIVVNANQVGKAINDLLSDTECRVAMGRQGKEWVSVNMTWDKVARKMEKVYLRILDSGPTHRA